MVWRQHQLPTRMGGLFNDTFHEKLITLGYKLAYQGTNNLLLVKVIIFVLYIFSTHYVFEIIPYHDQWHDECIMENYCLSK